MFKDIAIPRRFDHNGGIPGRLQLANAQNCKRYGESRGNALERAGVELGENGSVIPRPKGEAIVLQTWVRLKC